MLGRTKSVAFSTILFGASLIPVHSLTLSSSCQASLRGLLESDDAACLNAPALISSVLGAQDDINVPRIMDSYLTSLCSSGSCSDDSLAAVTRNLTSGCSEDLAALEINLEGLQDKIVDVVQQVYPTVREIACLKDNNANQFCATQTLDNLSKVIGGLNFDDLSFLDLFADARRLVQSGAQSLACTDCMKEAFTIARSDFPSIVSQVDDEVSGFCGASFVDGVTPDSVTQTAQPGIFAASQGQGNSASTVFRNAGSVIVGVSLAFVLMA
ncbi:hypothetical protein Moror_6397 [Moniliophthora roreri MCA 2997]|uniref:Uncharacterized protein n=1 Tax=Moniliophthora roreri (strain MCA 2997) TaxID=1381753 RepID=V2XWU4_MONRO|nr:hypothetical protein Moror_6397 [Moniliophthora roreri MCA 2997]KAI3618751.1 hypothetical protein WG66_016505 [Moniliophthora roreri]